MDFHSIGYKLELFQDALEIVMHNVISSDTLGLEWAWNTCSSRLAVAPEHAPTWLWRFPVGPGGGYGEPGGITLSPGCSIGLPLTRIKPPAAPTVP